MPRGLKPLLVSATRATVLLRWPWPPIASILAWANSGMTVRVRTGRQAWNERMVSSGRVVDRVLGPCVGEAGPRVGHGSRLGDRAHGPCFLGPEPGAVIALTSP